MVIKMANKITFIPNPNYLKNLELSLQPKLNQAAEVVKEQAISEVPVDTGVLRDSIQKWFEAGTSLKAYIVAYAPYAWFVEKGTRKMAPNPFLRRALQNSQDAIRSIFKCR
jgi:HK97 gp10 family phage protein